MIYLVTLVLLLLVPKATHDFEKAMQCWVRFLATIGTP